MFTQFLGTAATGTGAQVVVSAGRDGGEGDGGGVHSRTAGGVSSSAPRCEPVAGPTPPADVDRIGTRIPMPMMTSQPAFVGSALWFPGNPTTAGNAHRHRRLHRRHARHLPLPVPPSPSPRC